MITAAARATTQIEELVREAGRQESRQEGMQAGRQLDSNTHQPSPNPHSTLDPIETTLHNP